MLAHNMYSCTPNPKELVNKEHAVVMGLENLHLSSSLVMTHTAVGSIRAAGPQGLIFSFPVTIVLGTCSVWSFRSKFCLL